MAPIMLLLLLSSVIRGRPTCATDDVILRLFSDHVHSALALNASHSVLSHLLIPRVPGTSSHAHIQHLIMDYFSSLPSTTNSTSTYEWVVEVDEFSTQTPLGPLPFTNLIARFPPRAHHYLTLACHYDSKYFPDIDFIGATDSAAPCAILLDIATLIHPLLVRAQLGYSHGATVWDRGVQMVFFDGEEAFHDWSDRDSLYGSRHLAHFWSHSPPTTSITPPVSPSSSPPPPLLKQPTTRLDQIDLLVLLDLLGSDEPWPQIHNYHPQLRHEFNHLRLIERRLLILHLLPSQLSHSPKNKNQRKQKHEFYFTSPKNNPYTTGSTLIDDDHRPFVDRGVRALHIIPAPFPSVWHTVQDDASALREDIVMDFARVFAVLVVEACGLVAHV